MPSHSALPLQRQWPLGTFWLRLRVTQIPALSHRVQGKPVSSENTDPWGLPTQRGLGAKLEEAGPREEGLGAPGSPSRGQQEVGRGSLSAENMENILGSLEALWTI